MNARNILPIALSTIALALLTTSPATAAEPFPAELVEFIPHQGNPVFAGTGRDTWDRKIRERGYILREPDGYHLWYTGYDKNRPATMSLGYATSADGLHWSRHPANPIFDKSWVEDMCVVKQGDTYYMFAEGRNDIAHLLTSTDRVNWRDLGRLDVRSTSGQPLSAGPYGTPTVWVEGGIWYLFHERNDRGIWLATSKDRRRWTNVSDRPVLRMGPEPYDRGGVAMNQIVKHKGRYYACYHGSSHRPGNWSTNLAVSPDLVHWTKYPKNPIVAHNRSSGILVPDADRWRLYTMHPDVRVFLPK